MDGKPLTFPRTIQSDHPSQKNRDCPCGGSLYLSSGARYARCSEGETRCTRCFRVARKFGRGGLTCGTGCADAS